MHNDDSENLMPAAIEPEGKSIEELKELQKPKRVWSRKEKLLLALSLIIAILFDRLIIASLFDWNFSRESPATFWLSYLAIFCAFYWKRIKSDKVLLYVTICSVALCVWNFIFPNYYNSQYAAITFLVIPGVLMAHAQWAAGDYSLKNPAGIVPAWILGWMIKPFSGIHATIGSAISLISEDNKPVAKRAIIGTILALALLIIVVPLLMGADMVFNHYVMGLFSGWNFSSFAMHSFFVVIIFALFYSFIWNVGFGKKDELYRASSEGMSIDIVISSIVLGSVTLVYVMFCLVQFTYLFARAGLPEGMTYAEYAREGFAQTVLVCAINLLLFGIFMWKGQGKKILSGLLSGLLALTLIMLISGAVRLNLYIDAFGMTWLRLLSAWFIIYLVIVIVLCVVRLFKKEMPVVGLSAMVLLIWYIALGYLNPDGFIDWFNQMALMS